MTRAEILDAAKGCVTGQRIEDYGTPEDSFSMIAQLWTAYLEHSVSPMDVAVMMGLLKIARIKGTRSTQDSFVDLAGYAACAGEIATEDGGDNPQSAELTVTRGESPKGTPSPRSLSAAAGTREAELKELEQLLGPLLEDSHGRAWLLQELKVQIASLKEARRICQLPDKPCELCKWRFNIAEECVTSRECKWDQSKAGLK